MERSLGVSTKVNTLRRTTSGFLAGVDLTPSEECADGGEARQRFRSPRDKVVGDERAWQGKSARGKATNMPMGDQIGVAREKMWR